MSNDYIVMTTTVVIMAAGRGTRMKDVAPDLPKHLLPVLGRPFLEYTFDRVREAGFTRIIVITGHLNHAFNGYEATHNIELIEQKKLHERYGTAAAVETVHALVGNELFAVIAGDNLYSVNDLKKMTVDSTTQWIGGYRTAAWQGMGILKQKDDSSLDRIVEKPATFVGDLINASLYLFTPKIFDAIAEIKPSPRGEYELTDAINLIAGRESVNVFELEDRWLDLTAPADVGKIEKALQQARA